jgi:hypothetical protein
VCPEDKHVKTAETDVFIDQEESWQGHLRLCRGGLVSNENLRIKSEAYPNDLFVKN